MIPTFKFLIIPFNLAYFVEAGFGRHWLGAILWRLNQSTIARTNFFSKGKGI